MTDQIRRLAEELSAGGDISLFPDEPMNRHTSFRIGGPAGLFAVPHTTEGLIRILDEARKTEARTYILGNGSNVLFDDCGFDGVVVSTGGFNTVTAEEDGRISAGAGASLSSVCKAARDASLTGLEFAYGIPGSVGGAVVMNAGAYGGEMAQVIESSRYLDRETLEIRDLSLAGHAYGYRDSVYRHSDRIVLSAAFRLNKGRSEEIALAMSDYASRRTSKQPLEYPSAGSVFKRPEGHFVGQMVEESGLKGFRIGGAEVSEKHAGFIVNRGGATSRDVLALVEHIRDTVRRNYGVELECEIIHVK
ncbi:MAG: UDP-N-acetylmuramate dehydrogenase [Ruminococcaceae bacterium]|jgi:UDP-N-acetylmuramate dehydrogenase|nr:UDP-N-acetylmuramate dehydrogenase [Oscillospiraceae bacterium]